MKQKIIENLKTKIIGKNIIIFDKIDSTQTEAKKLAKKGIENGTIIIADEQINGIGTHGRTWYTKKGKNIAFTIIIFPECNINELKNFTFDIANCIVESIYNISNEKLNIKIPNDIMINNKKVGGILTQVITEGEKIKYILIGIGINVNETDFSGEIKDIATSLKIEFKKDFQREEILAEICNLFEKYCIEKRII